MIFPNMNFKKTDIFELSFKHLNIENEINQIN